MSCQVDTIPKERIREYASGWTGGEGTLVPISPERGASQEANPHALPDDPLLWVAHDPSRRVIAFTGSLPGEDRHGGGRLGWNSCWWADPRRGSECALPLFLRFLDAWDRRVAFSDMTTHTRAIIEKLGFAHLREEPLFLFRVRIPSGKPSPGSAISSRLAHAAAVPLSVAVHPIVHARIGKPRVDSSGRIEWHDRLDDSLFEFIRAHRSRDFVWRTKAEYAWIQDHPWLTEHAGSGRTLAYPFSRIVNRFRTGWLVSRREDSPTTCMFVSVRDGALKVCSYFGPEPADAVESIRWMVRRDRRIHTVILSHPLLAEQEPQLRRMSLRTERKVRLMGISREILPAWPPDMVMQLGDGDAVFT